MKAQLSMCDFGKLQLNTQNLNSGSENGISTGKMTVSYDPAKFRFGGLWDNNEKPCDIQIL